VSDTDKKNEDFLRKLSKSSYYILLLKYSYFRISKETEHLDYFDFELNQNLVSEEQHFQ